MLARFSVDTHSIPVQVVYFQLNLEPFHLDTACEMKGTGQLGFLEGLSDFFLLAFRSRLESSRGSNHCVRPTRRIRSVNRGSPRSWSKTDQYLSEVMK